MTVSPPKTIYDPGETVRFKAVVYKNGRGTRLSPTLSYPKNIRRRRGNSRAGKLTLSAGRGVLKGCYRGKCDRFSFVVQDVEEMLDGIE